MQNGFALILPDCSSLLDVFCLHACAPRVTRAFLNQFYHKRCVHLAWSYNGKDLCLGFFSFDFSLVRFHNQIFFLHTLYTLTYPVGSVIPSCLFSLTLIKCQRLISRFKSKNLISSFYFSCIPNEFNLLINQFS